MNINARNLAAALAYLGADVEAALLELAAVSPSLDARVRGELYRNSERAKLRLIRDRTLTQLFFTAVEQPRWSCAMHAVDQICRVLNDEQVVEYLKVKFSEYTYALQALQEVA